MSEWAKISAALPFYYGVKMADALTVERLIAETEVRFDQGKLEIIYARRDGDLIYCTMMPPKPYQPTPLSDAPQAWLEAKAEIDAGWPEKETP